MSNEIVKIDFTQEQVNLIKTQIAPKANDNELKLFLYQAKRTGLDPLARQIYAIHRWNSQQGKEVMTIQTSIDGFRVIAERSGDYAGQDEPIFEYSESGLPIKCKVTVCRFHNDYRYPAAVGVAHWNEYVQTDKQGNPSGLWKKMPHVMLAKVAEALALRKAYPQDLSGLYTSEEMQQSDVVKQEEQFTEVEEQHEMIIPISDFERDDLFNLLNTSTYEGKVKDKLFSKINGLSTREDYDKAKQNLLANQLGIDGAVNPSQSEINKHIRKIAQPA